ncbi:MAG TPA: porin [Telluria sp.]|nr:porin [Telluria sp.]
MYKRALALALGAAFAAAAPAHAQSTNVTIYGLMDAGVEYINHANATDASQVRVISGGKNTSRWGLRGSEDLGGGLKAVFNLEGGILLDTGNADGALFKRQANIGLEGGFGRVVIGRSFTTTYDLVIQFDPMGFAPNYSWATSGPATGPSKYGMTTAFDNLVKYTYKKDGVMVGATVGLGEQNTAQEGRKYAVGGAYKFGKLNTMLSYEAINGVNVAATGRHDEISAIHAGADYRDGKWRVAAGLRSYKLVSGKAATADVKADTTWAGVSYMPAPYTITGAVYHVNVKNVASGQDADPTMIVARVMKALSKRTDLYLSVAHVSSKNGKLTGLSRDDAGFADTQTGITAGIQHRF